MCTSPSYVWIERGPKWEQSPVACRQCWRCKRNRVDDYVGRALCEASTSVATATITLTYAPRDDLADKVLTPRHFQLFIKLLRRAGHKVRYLVVGEYGGLKGRAHFHAILFFSHIVPLPPLTIGEVKDGMVQQIPRRGSFDAPFCRQIPQKRMCHIREWPHGHISVDWNANEKSVRYVCKYLLADDKNNAWFSLSKKPALGAAWFAQKAEKAKEFGVLPSSFEYMPPGGNRDKSYLITGASRRDYLNAITTDATLGSRMSEWVRKTFDKYALQRWQAELDDQPPHVLIQYLADKCASKEADTEAIMHASKMREFLFNMHWLDMETAIQAKLMGFDNVEAFIEWWNETVITDFFVKLAAEYY